MPEAAGRLQGVTPLSTALTLSRDGAQGKEVKDPKPRQPAHRHGRRLCRPLFSEGRGWASGPPADGERAPARAGSGRTQYV